MAKRNILQVPTILQNPAVNHDYSLRERKPSGSRPVRSLSTHVLFPQKIVERANENNTETAGHHKTFGEKIKRLVCGQTSLCEKL